MSQLTKLLRHTSSRNPLRTSVDRSCGRFCLRMSVIVEHHYIFDRTLVTDHVTTETPLVAQNIGEQFLVGAGWDASYSEMHVNNQSTAAVQYNTIQQHFFVP